MDIPLVKCVDVTLLSAEYLQHESREIVRVRLEFHAFVRKCAQHRIPMCLQLIVEKHEFAAANLANATDDSAGLAILDGPRERGAIRERRPPGVVRQIERFPLRIAVDHETLNYGAAVGAESHDIGRVDCRGSGGNSGPMTVLAGFDLPKFFVIVVAELCRNGSRFAHQTLGVRLGALIDQSRAALWISNRK